MRPIAEVQGLAPNHRYLPTIAIEESEINKKQLSKKDLRLMLMCAERVNMREA
jgi:hypothetical protein